MADATRLTTVVTGGSRGIGKAIALALAESGMNVALVARNASALGAAADEIQVATGAEVLTVIADITLDEDVSRVVPEVVRRFGSVDVLVNNVGAAPFLSPVEHLKPGSVEKYLRANFVSVVNMTVAVAGEMLDRGSGCVLNVASVAGWIPSPGLSYYAAAKAAVLSFTKTTALEWAPRGVRVNALAPGFVATDMNADAREQEDFNRKVLASVPMGRWCQPDDLVQAAVFLCSSGAAFITGAVLTVNGGQALATQTGLVTGPAWETDSSPRRLRPAGVKNKAKPA